MPGHLMTTSRKKRERDSTLHGGAEIRPLSTSIHTKHQLHKLTQTQIPTIPSFVKPPPPPSLHACPCLQLLFVQQSLSTVLTQQSLSPPSTVHSSVSVVALPCQLILRRVRSKGEHQRAKRKQPDTTQRSKPNSTEDGARPKENEHVHSETT